MASNLFSAILFVTPVKAYHNYWSNENDVNFVPLNVTFSNEIVDTSNVSDTHARATQHEMADIYFDRSIYYPDVRVFWESNLSVPIEIRVVDINVNDTSVKVDVWSSIDSKEVTLTRDITGVFSGTVFAVGVGLMSELSLNTSSLKARYGDEIIAEYFDISSVTNLTASALFLFPHYIMQNFCNNPDSWEHNKRMIFDSNGIPLYNYSSSIGPQYNPVTVSQYALANYHVYLDTGNYSRREKFLSQARWLLENAKQKESYSIWEYDFDYPKFYCTKPWVSAMAQGQGLSVLVRAYVLTGNISYIDVAEQVALAFEVEISDGGVRYIDSNGVWFEEYADVGAPRSKVLNGFIFALLGLYEYSFETNNSKGWTFFWEGAETLSKNIYRYDSSSWSYYGLLKYTHAGTQYHKIVIEQLRTMYELTDDEIFLCYSDRFQSYPYPPPPPPSHYHTLTINATVGGTTDPLPGTYDYTAGSSQNVTAIPNSGYSFHCWLFDGEERAENPIPMIMDNNHALEAFFTSTPSASFTYSPEAPTIRDTVYFYDASRDPDGTIVSWYWSFGDGDTSTNKDPTHNYKDKGTYWVRLTVFDNDGAQDVVTKSIIILNLPPIAGFTFLPTNPKKGENIQFKDESQDPEGKTIQYSWNFGDGYSSTQNNPTHKFKEGGEYTIRLTIRDDEGEINTISKKINIIQTYNLTIKVKDILGVAISKVDIGLYEDGECSATGSTDKAGTRTLTEIPEGNYEVRVTVMGSTTSTTIALTRSMIEQIQVALSINTIGIAGGVIAVVALLGLYLIWIRKIALAKYR